MVIINVAPSSIYWNSVFDSIIKAPYVLKISIPNKFNLNVINGGHIIKAETCTLNSNGNDNGEK